MTCFHCNRIADCLVEIGRNCSAESCRIDDFLPLSTSHADSTQENEDNISDEEDSVPVNVAKEADNFYARLADKSK